MDAFLDVALLGFHAGLIGFILLGWAWRRSRRWHLLVCSLTLLSWFGLGAFYGLGYCPATDWHWEVKRRLGETDLPASYVKYYADRISGRDWNPLLIDGVVLVLGIGAFAASVWFNWTDRRRDRSGLSAAPS